MTLMTTETPPVETPPTETPPVETPPVETPPTETPPAPTEEPPKETPQEGAPEKYEFKAPEGNEFNPEVIAAFSEVAKELNLTQDGAQKLLDKMSTTMAAQQDQQVQNIRTEWETAAKSDKEIGGDKFDANLAVAKKALESFASPELVELLNQSGLGSHPEMIRAFYKIGTAISEDKIVKGTASPSDEKTVAQRLYPNMNP